MNAFKEQRKYIFFSPFPVWFPRSICVSLPFFHIQFERNRSLSMKIMGEYKFHGICRLFDILVDAHWDWFVMIGNPFERLKVSFAIFCILISFLSSNSRSLSILSIESFIIIWRVIFEHKTIFYAQNGKEYFYHWI